MQNHELIKKLKDRIGDVSTEVPILVYTASMVLDLGAYSQEAYDLAVKTIEDYLNDGIQASLDL
jgi:hypothetical protein